MKNKKIKKLGSESNHYSTLLLLNIKHYNETVVCLGIKLIIDDLSDGFKKFGMDFTLGMAAMSLKTY